MHYFYQRNLPQETIGVECFWQMWLPWLWSSTVLCVIRSVNISCNYWSQWFSDDPHYTSNEEHLRRTGRHKMCAGCCRSFLTCPLIWTSSFLCIIFVLSMYILGCVYTCVHINMYCSYWDCLCSIHIGMDPIQYRIFTSALVLRYNFAVLAFHVTVTKQTFLLGAEPEEVGHD